MHVVGERLHTCVTLTDRVTLRLILRDTVPQELPD